MTTPKVSTIRRGGSRFYVHPETAEKVPGVTSVVGMLPKPFLTGWAAKITAETAVDSLGEVVGLALKNPQGAVDYLKRAHRLNTSEAADTGSQVHDLCEKLARGEATGPVHPDLQPFVAGFQDFLDRFSPTFLHLEETVWSDRHHYAGSFDAIAEVDGEVVIMDWKTTRSGVHAEVALQLTAYAMADFILTEHGDRVDLPAIEAGAVVHLRPEGWQLVPVRIGEDLFEVFQALLQVFTWDRELKDTVLGKDVKDRPRS